MEEGLLDLLRGTAALTPLTGPRIYWGRRPQGRETLPAIVLTRLGGRRDSNLGGPSGLVDSLVQADIYATRYREAKRAARAVRDAVNGYSGNRSGTFFQLIAIANERDSSATAAAGEPVFRISIDLTVWHDE